MKVNFLYDYKKYKGSENMALDLMILDNAVKNKSEDLYVRFYGWEPKCISLGRNQTFFNPTGINIDIVRRPTGGRALLHDMEITYLVVGKIPDGQKVIETYKMISSILINGFGELGISLEFGGERGGKNNYCMNISSGADICFNGKKFIGSAQYRKNGYFLQHGSILKDIDIPFAEKVFGEPFLKDKITTLKEINPDITDKEVIEAIKKSFINFSRNIC